MPTKYGGGYRSSPGRSRRVTPSIPKARHLPTHETVGTIADNFGKWVHYKAHTTGEFRWRCACNYDVLISVRIEKEYGARIVIKHRSKVKQFTTVEPRAKDILDRIEQVVSFAKCGYLPWLGWL